MVAAQPAQPKGPGQNLIGVEVTLRVAVRQKPYGTCPPFLSTVFQAKCSNRDVRVATASAASKWVLEPVGPTTPLRFRIRASVSGGAV